MPPIDTGALLTDVKTAGSSNEFEGRAPGTKGEALTVQH